jgi:hypothetical protein
MDKLYATLGHAAEREQWQALEIYSYALEWNGQPYPVKNCFARDGSTRYPIPRRPSNNTYVEKYGLKLIEIPPGIPGTRINIQEELASST